MATKQRAKVVFASSMPPGGLSPLQPSPPRAPSAAGASPPRGGRGDFVARKFQVLMTAWDYFAELCAERGTAQYVLSLTQNGAAEWRVASDDSELRSTSAPSAPLFTPQQPKSPSSFGSPGRRPSEADTSGQASDGAANSGKAYKDALRDSEARQRRLVVELERTKELWKNASHAAKKHATEKVKATMQGELDAAVQKIKELVHLTERCGERIRDQEGTIEALTARVRDLEETLRHEQRVHSESVKVAQHLMIQYDELGWANAKLERQLNEGAARAAAGAPPASKEGDGEAAAAALPPIAAFPPEAVHADVDPPLPTPLRPTVPHDDRENVSAPVPPQHPTLRGRGDHALVPLALRTPLPAVRNLNISTAALTTLLEDMWATRYRLCTAQDALPEYVGDAVIGGGTAHHIALRLSLPPEMFMYADYGNTPLVKNLRAPFQVFFHEYVKERWVNATEWAYSIVDACERNRHVTDFETFLEVLNGEMPEDMYVDYVVTIHKFRHTLSEGLVPDGDLAEWEGREGYDPKGVPGDVLPISYFMREVESFFANKRPGQLAALKESVMRDVREWRGEGAADDATMFPWAMLFPTAGRSAFLGTLQAQHYNDVHGFNLSLANAIDLAAGGRLHCTLDAVRQQVLLKDPHQPPAALAAWLNLLIGRGPGDELSHCHVPHLVADLIPAMKKLLLRRYGRLHTCYGAG
eukprot:TRINITY_DN2075_c0_g3_i1.p1 TRINITY_DN2075_c0_g3~~TRINITY_DN2075_c0_g3_i1.p1  ORF type:complete len:745 (+),score=209.39 TRINITY_DN2075_c0_g3_i1:143-2236(+)